MWELSATKDIKKDLELINENALAKENRLLTLNHLGEFIQNHSTLTELSVPSLKSCETFCVQQNQRQK